MSTGSHIVCIYIHIHTHTVLSFPGRYIVCIIALAKEFCSMEVVSLLLLNLLWSLVEVHSQTEFPEFPYVSFRGEILPNHGYVNLRDVGTSNYRSVNCHTDLCTCCNDAHGPHHGNWYFPDGSTVEYYSSGSIFYKQDIAQRVNLYRRSYSSRSGIYRCDIATIAVHNLNREAVFVGLYYNGGMFRTIIPA